MRLDCSVDWIADVFDSCWNNWNWINRSWISFRLKISVYRIHIFVLVFTYSTYLKFGNARAREREPYGV